MSESTASAGEVATGVRDDTASRATRALGVLALVGVAALVLFGMVLSPRDSEQGDLVRIMYVHVPSAWLAYLSFVVTAVGSVLYLRRRSVWADLVAGSSAEIGVLFCGLALVTGSIWGRPTWGTYWEWGDARIVSTMVLFLMYLGYLALRRSGGDEVQRSKRAAVVGLVGALNIPVVHMSVEWWSDRTLHQKATVASPDLDPKIGDLQLFTLMLGLVVFMVVYGWMLLHRFRIAWLERELEGSGLDVALAERRAEALVGVEAAVGATVRNDLTSGVER